MILFNTIYTVSNTMQ